MTLADAHAAPRGASCHTAIRSAGTRRTAEKVVDGVPLSANPVPPGEQSSKSDTVPSGTAFERFLERWLIDHGIRGLLHGTIFILAILLVLGAHPPSHSRIILIVVLTAVATALADAYAQVTEVQIREHRSLQMADQAEALNDVGSVLVAAVPPLIIFALSWVGLFEIPTAFKLAQGASVALFGACGYLSRRVVGSSVLEGAIGALVAIAIGGGIVWLKALVH